MTGYAYGAPLLYGGTFIPVAMPTALSLVLEGLGQVRLAVPRVAGLRAWRHPSLRGRLLRTFVPTALLLILIEGWADVALGTVHAPNSALWHSVVALAAGALFVVITGWIARRSGDDIEAAQARLEIRVKERTAELGQVNHALQTEVAERKSAEEALQQVCDGPEQRVAERTVASRRVNEELRTEVADRTRAEQALHHSREQFRALAARLQAVREEERIGIARELHDELGQALTNVVRHAHATWVEVRLSVADGELLLDVQDNGRGTTPEQIAAPRSLGFLSMRERAAVLGGTMDIQSEPGRGTTVQVRMPSAISSTV